MTIEKNTPVQPSTVPTHRRGAWSSAGRGVVAAGGALAVALLATACTQASAAVPEEPSAVPSAVSQPAEAAPSDSGPSDESDEREATPAPAAPSETRPSDESDEREATPAPAAPSETRPSDEGEPRPVPTVPGERAEQELAVTG
ncbi:hypothetical protein [Promicromonospora sp. NPDC057488]|uniref:hypothetical protein n=1 Tax=Promicromonospora sp. NPDC057488 TaxID=3346147 RepID=UPI0036720076